MQENINPQHGPEGERSDVDAEILSEIVPGADSITVMVFRNLPAELRVGIIKYFREQKKENVPLKVRLLKLGELILQSQKLEGLGKKSKSDKNYIPPLDKNTEQLRKEVKEHLEGRDVNDSEEEN